MKEAKAVPFTNMTKSFSFAQELSCSAIEKHDYVTGVSQLDFLLGNASSPHAAARFPSNFPGHSSDYSGHCSVNNDHQETRQLILEWGMPLARGGRELLLPLLKAQKGLTVWIYSSKLGCVYPPAWRARGVDLDRLYFVRNDGSLSALRALFLEPLFQCVVIDSPMKWRPEDLFFLRTAAKRNKFHLLLLRPFFLSNKKGNPLCRQRFNVSYHVKQKSYRVHKLKGPNLGTYWINREALFKCH